MLFPYSDLASAITGAQYAIDGARTATGGGAIPAMQIEELHISAG